MINKQRAAKWLVRKKKTHAALCLALCSPLPCYIRMHLSFCLFCWLLLLLVPFILFVFVLLLGCSSSFAFYLSFFSSFHCVSFAARISIVTTYYCFLLLQTFFQLLTLINCLFLYHFIVVLSFTLFRIYFKWREAIFGPGNSDCWSCVCVVCVNLCVFVIVASSTSSQIESRIKPQQKQKSFHWMNAIVLHICLRSSGDKR